MNGKPIIAIMYDFDKTLCTKDMQGYGFIPSLGITEEEFWNYANEIGHKEHMDSILAYMYAMVKISKDKNIPLLREKLVETGKKVELFDGVSKWFSRINNFGKKLGVCVEHYVISSGLKEIIEGTDIANEFKSIFACEFLYDENGNGIWPKTDVNYTNKTQFVYRINKGVLDVANDQQINARRQQAYSFLQYDLYRRRSFRCTVYENDESIRRIFHCRISKKRRKSRRFITAWQS